MIPPTWTPEDVAEARDLAATLTVSTFTASDVLMVALIRRLDTFAASMAETVQGATSGGLLGLLTGGRR